VFCGNYVTPVPPGYFEHLLELRGKKPKGLLASSTPAPQLVASSGPTIVENGTGSNGDMAQHLDQIRSSVRSPALREDISLHNVASER
jgi:amidophosphoribosyltransferase